MSRLGKIARRSFLFGSAAIVGGVAFGYYAYKRPHPNPLLDDLAEGDAALTPYVLITSGGITLITPRADKGQGAYSLQAALIAEELDVDLDQVQVDPGPPAPAYYNTAVAGEGVPFPVNRLRHDRRDRARSGRGRYEIHGAANHRRIDHGTRWLGKAAHCRSSRA